MSRAYCYQCQRVKSACVCDRAVSIDNPVNVYVLQHPDEARHSKGTAIIARLCLQNYHCWQGEDFSSHPALNQLIKDSADEICVVYPSATAMELNPAADTINDKIRHLIFIDATWRKAKKIWSLSDNLHKLTTIKLSANRKSTYRIRKVPADGFLSTIEAISFCLADIENDSDKYQPMLALFDHIIDAKIEDMGGDIYAKHYQNKP